VEDGQQVFLCHQCTLAATPFGAIIPIRTRDEQASERVMMLTSRLAYQRPVQYQIPVQYHGAGKHITVPASTAPVTKERLPMRIAKSEKKIHPFDAKKKDQR
jgi:hypothetical protein